jgi:Uup-like ABC transporter family protein
VEVAGGRLTVHPGNYDDYMAAQAPPPVAPAPARAAVDAPAAPPREGRARRPRVDPAVREMRRRLEALETQIHALEARLRELGETLSDPGLYQDGERVRTVAAERKRAEEQVAWLMNEWEELSTALASHEAP